MSDRGVRQASWIPPTRPVLEASARMLFSMIANKVESLAVMLRAGCPADDIAADLDRTAADIRREAADILGSAPFAGLLAPPASQTGKGGGA